MPRASYWADFGLPDPHEHVFERHFLGMPVISWVCLSFSPPVEPISSRKPTIVNGLEPSFQLPINGRSGRKQSVR
jgi:hypothetical protein